jgi:prepilin-type N-terminal cleavage/methylation domain-containing protein
MFVTVARIVVKPALRFCPQPIPKSQKSSYSPSPVSDRAGGMSVGMFLAPDRASMRLSRYKSSHQAGFTLVEVMAAIGVIAVLVAIAVPNLFSVLRGLRLSDGARQLASELQLARMKAISQHTKYRVSFGSYPTTTYSLEKHDGVTFAVESGPSILPEGITVTGVSPSVSEFQSGGTVNTTSTITLSNGSATKQIQVNLIGRVKIL